MTRATSSLKSQLIDLLIISITAVLIIGIFQFADPPQNPAGGSGGIENPRLQAYLTDLPHFQQACRQGDETACQWFAATAQSMEPRDRKLAVAYFDAACEVGRLPECWVVDRLK